jgi:parallel beta-helix repeat protein
MHKYSAIGVHPCSSAAAPGNLKNEPNGTLPRAALSPQTGAPQAKNRRSKTIIVTSSLLILALSTLHAATLYISPQGKPGAPGTRQAPLDSLASARDHIRALRKTGNHESMTVLLRQGTYFLDQTFVLTPEDSGVTYAACPHEHAILSGGRKITGWTKGSGRFWTAPVTGDLRQLFVAGRRAQRARIPTRGFLRSDGHYASAAPFVMKFRGDDIKKSWADLGDVELVALAAWQVARQPIVSVDEAAHTARLSGNAPMPTGKTNSDVTYFIENAPEGLNFPGNWRLDRKTSTVSYWAYPGEDPSREEVIAPAVVQLVRLEGKPEAGELVRHVAFRGLDFRHADWVLPANGYTSMQSSAMVQAAFTAEGVEDLAIEHCRFADSGGYAISIGRGSKSNRVLSNEIFDMGAGGIKIGEPLKDQQRANPAERNGANTVNDNEIHNLGLVYPDGAGIILFQTSDNTVSHNHVHDLFYSAISVGWTWHYKPEQSQRNIIEYNHLHHLGQNVMSDMGGIYTLGESPGTILRHNLIHDVTGFSYGGWGIYLDQASSQILVENNIVYNCSHAGFNQNFGRENIVRNNIFAFNRDFQATRNKAEDHLSFTFERNIVYFDQGRLLGNNWSGGLKMNHNLYWDARGGDLWPAGKTWADWQSSGMDTESQIADPLFAGPGNFDFRLQPNSPARKLGFKEIDNSDAGTRGRPGPEL